MIFGVLWILQALFVGTILSAIESGHGPFKFRTWAYLVGVTWPAFLVFNEIQYYIAKWKSR